MNPLFTHSWLHGVQTSPVYNAPTAETHVLGLLFEPPGLHRLLGCDMTLLCDRTVDARGHMPKELLSQLEGFGGTAGEPTAHDRLHACLCSTWLEKPLPWLTHLYDAIKASRGAISLADAYARTGHSARHVNARFKQACGVSPKVLARIYRLEALLAAIDPSKHVNWAGLAHDAGFYDQAHFNREFKRFSGLTPARYLDERARDLPELGAGDHVSFVPQR